MLSKEFLSDTYNSFKSRLRYISGGDITRLIHLRLC